MHKRRWIIICLLALTACAQPAVKPSTPTETIIQPSAQPADHPSSLDALLKFSQNFAVLPAEAQKREHGQINAARRTEFSRMQLVMMAVQPGSRYKDEGRAAVLVDEYLKSDARDEGLRTLAQVIKSLLAVARQEAKADPKQEENMAQLMQKLKDEQKRADTLQRKLDELLAVEKTLNERREGTK